MASKLLHDSDGFLTGQRTTIDRASYAKHLMILKAIRDDGADMRDDMSAIRKTLAGAIRPNGPSSSKISRIPALSPASRASSASGETKIPASVPSENLAQPRKRVRPDVDAGRSADTAGRKWGAEAASALKSAAMEMKGSAGSALSGAEGLDPTIAAAKEVKDMASPVLGMLKPVVGLFQLKGSKDAEAGAKIAVPWYRRLWHELRDINKKSGGPGGKGGMFDGLLGTLAKIPLLGMLGKGVGGLLGGLLRGGGRMLGGAGGLLGSLGRGIFKKIPILGALFAGGSALSSIFGSDDPSKSPEENRRARFTGGGSGIGMLLGGAVGMIGGPLGAIAGAAIGDVVGTKVGEWLSTVNWEDVGKTISDTWKTSSEWVKTSFGGVFDFVKSSWAKVAGLGERAFKAVGDWADEKAGKIKALAVGAATAVTGATSSAYRKASDLKEAATISGGRLLGSLAKGYRHRESFDGISGGDGLAKNGTYTNDEADRIRQLKMSGSNTSANLKGGMPDRIRKKIEAQALADGLNPKDMLKVAAMESGGNANAISATGAIGVYQFTGKTATGVGITNRFDEDQNIAGGMRLAKENQAYLKKMGLPVTPENLYMMHQLGPSAAAEVIRGSLSGKRIDQLSQGAQFGIRNNYGAGSSTAADYLAKNSKALDDRYNQVVRPKSPSVAAAIPSIPPMLRPISTSSPSMTYTPTAPDFTKYAPSPTPPLKIPLASSGKGSQSSSPQPPPLTQNVGDRNIAAVATGGIGGGSLRS